MCRAPFQVPGKEHPSQWARSSPLGWTQTVSYVPLNISEPGGVLMPNKAGRVAVMGIGQGHGVALVEPKWSEQASPEET